MKISRSFDEKLLLYLNTREKEVLFSLLRRYPRIPAKHHKLSRETCLSDQESGERMLEEALAEQRSAHRSKLERLLTDETRLEPRDGGYRLNLSASETEWLLQVLNDIRVGSWLLLGAPGEKPVALNEKTAPDIWAMEASGFFQMGILEALDT